MNDNMCEEIAIKINWDDDVLYCDGDDMWKLEDTDLPLNGIYEDEEEIIRCFKNGKYHNENGPAFIRKDGCKEYVINNKTHRIDGPARIYTDGSIEWYINGHYIKRKIMDNWLKENDIPFDYKTWTDSDKMLFALHWSDYNG